VRDVWTILKDLEISSSDVCWAAVWEELCQTVGDMRAVSGLVEITTQVLLTFM